jgi:two-component system response regulator HydG
MSPDRKNPPTLLVVDDDPMILALLRHWLKPMSDVVAFRTAATGAEAIEMFESATEAVPDLMLLDLGLPDMDGLQVLGAARRARPGIPTAVLTLSRDVGTVVSSMRAGADEYVAKPVEQGELVRIVEKLAHVARLRATEEYGNVGDLTTMAFPDIVGESAPMQLLFEQMARVASRDVTVLVHGESGTGKELVARALHDQSPRRAGPFVAINCAAIPESLQESELFGHEKGAFTGAAQRHAGRFEQARGGTLFLDEIGEIAPSLQASLLRAIQERRFFRVGGQTEVSVDVRIIAATHRDLMREVASGRFREDLYYRLAVFELEVPPLRARNKDVIAIAARLLRDIAARHGLGRLDISPDVTEALLAHDWPGNVRELQNALERAAVLAEGRRIEVADLPPRIRAAPTQSTAHRAASEPEVEDSAPVAFGTQDVSPPAFESGRLVDMERQLIVETMTRTAGNIAAACRILGMARSTLYRKLKRHEIDPDAFNA